VSQKFIRVVGSDSDTALVVHKPSSVGEFLNSIGATSDAGGPDSIGPIVGAAVGGLMYRKTHPILGVFGGAILGKNLPAMLVPEHRSAAVCNIGIAAACVAGSLIGGKRGHSVIGFGLGWLTGGLIVHYGGFRK
jgi:hypothetical protein